MNSEIKILIIDDDSAFRKTLSDILRTKGYTPIHVGRGHSALHTVEDEKPSIVIIDLKLADMSGLEVMKRIKDRSPETDCIVLTGYASQESAIEAINVGAYSYLKKPYDVEHLLVTIQRVLEKQKAERALRNSEQEKATILESLAELVSYQDTDLRIVWANRAAAASVNLTPQQLIGRRCHQIWHQRKTPCKDCPVVKAIKTGASHEGEMITPDGRMWWIRGYPVLDEAGKVTGVVETTLDITARKSAGEALRASEEKYRLLFTTANEGILLLDMKGVVQDVNPRFLNMCGFEREEMVGRNVIHLATLFKIDRRQVLSKFRAFLSSTLQVSDWTISTKKGESIHIRVFPSFITKDGKRTGISTIIADVTERKRTEEALRESEEKFRNLAEQSPNMIFINKGGRIVYANRRCEEMMGYSKEEFYAPDFDFLTLIAPEHIDIIKETYAKHMRGKDVAPYEYALITKNSLRIEAIINPKLIHYEGEQALLGIITDITELKKTEEALRKEHDLVTQITETSPAGICVVNREGHITFANSRAEEVLGITKDKITQRVYNDPTWHITDFDGGPFPDEQLPFRIIMNTGKPAFDVRHAIEWPDGKRILLSINAAPLYDQSGCIDGMIATVENISERIRAQEILRTSEIRYRDLFERNMAAVYRTNIEGQILDCNSACAHLLGYTSREELICHSAFELYFDKEDRNTHVQRLLDRGKITNLERQLKRKDGSPIWILENINVIEEDDGPRVFQGTFIDITDRKEAERALQESEERYRTLFHRVPVGLYRSTPDGRPVNANQAMLDIMGYPDLRALSKINTTDSYVMSKDREHFEKLMEREDRVNGFETQLNRGDGNIIWARISARTVRDAAGQILMYEGSVEDITAQKQADEKLKKSERFLQNIFDGIHDGISILDADLNIVRVNQWIEKTYASQMPLTGKKCYAVYQCRESPCPFCPTIPTINTGESHTQIVPYPSQEKPTGWIELSAFPLEDDQGQIIGAIEHVKDITERRRAEMIQQVSFRIANAVYITVDLRELFRVIQKELGTILDTTNFFIALYHKETDTITLPYFIDEKDDFKTFPAGKTLTAWVIQREQPLLATQQDIENMAHRGEVESIGTKSKIWLGVPLKAKDEVIGALVVQSYENEKAYDEKDKELLQFVSSQIGLSIERKRYEESLKIERNKLGNILDNMRDSVIIEDEHFNIVYQNKSSRKLGGHLVGRKCFEALYHRSTPCEKKCSVRHFLKEKKSEPFQEINQTENGLFWDTIAVPITVEDGNKAVLVVSRNITEQKQLREQLLQSDKMSALGQLISGVAHELNNPMTGVLGFSQLLLSSQELPQHTQQTLEKIYQEADRARKIIHNLLTFARARRPEKRNIRINDILNQTLDLRAYEMKVSNIEVIRDFDPDLPSLFADEHQLQQVFMNLIINAEQAMIEAHEKGRLEVTTRWKAEHQTIRVLVHDDGPGIPKQNLTKIFDPFFTTKPVGKGTGLGLSVSFSIVHEHGGLIIVESEEGRGTTFRVELPVTDKTSAAPLPPQPKAEPAATPTGKRILAVDDEAAIVELVRTALEREGFEVTTAHDGNSALKKITEEHFDAVVSDLKMPGKGGIDVYTYCKRNKPNLAHRFLFLTGDVVAPESLQFFEENDLPYVSKPFDLQNLISSVNHLLHA